MLEVTNDSDQININTAGIAELTTLNGIGESLADRIISYREAEGGFSSLEDLKEVTGIGEKLFSGLKGQITNELQEANLEQLEIEETASSMSSSNMAHNQLEEEESPEDIMNIYSLPADYNDNKLVLQIKNPQTAHLYWEYKEERITEVVMQAGYQDVEEADLLLKVYNLTAGDSRDITIDFEHDSWYLNNLIPEHNYKVELGVRGTDQEFYSVLESNTVEMPRNTVSDVLDEKWMTVKEKLEKIYLLSGGLAEEGASSVDLVRELETDTELSELVSQLEENYSSEELVGSAEFLGASSSQVK
ncbi:DUF4912 domain-containing protein [Halanaerobaculum tunisiense]